MSLLHRRVGPLPVTVVVLLGALAVASPALGQGAAAARWLPRVIGGAMGTIGLGVTTNFLTDWIKQGWAATPGDEEVARDAYERGVRSMERLTPEWPGALQDFRKASQLGHPAAPFFVGRAYYEGHAVKRDPAAAAGWVRRSAERGYPPAMHTLAWLYDRGDGVNKDPLEAAIWARRGAEAGHAGAQLQFAYFLYAGEGTPRNHGEAFQWLRRSAEAGNVEAQYGMGWMFEHGDMGMARDGRLAVAWYRRAADRGHVEARQRLQRLGG